VPLLAVEGLAVLDEHLEERGDYVLIGDGRIVRVGRGKPPGHAKVVRVNGYIHPAIVDAHLHVTWLGLSMTGADLSGSRSPEEVARRLASAKGPIAYGRGWDQEEFMDPRSLPSRRLLDEAVPDRPAIAVRVCGHVAVANSLALSLAEPWGAYPGLVDRESGLILEDAVYYTVERLLERVPLEGLVRQALDALARAGVAGAASMACPVGEARVLASGRHRVRIACYPKPEALEEALQAAPGLVVGAKMFADGTLGARTAWLREDYDDDPGNRGVQLLSAGEIVEAGRRLLASGLRIAVHAIGDAALDEVVRAYEALQPGSKGRVEHASIAWDSQIEALAGLGVWTVVQPRFRISDWWIGERLGERARLAYRFRSMLGSGVRLALSSDSPVEPYAPWETLAAAVGDCPGGCASGEDIDTREAFYLYTRAAAQAAGGPVAGLGSMEPGSLGVVAWSRVPPGAPGWRGPEAIIWGLEW